METEETEVIEEQRAKRVVQRTKLNDEVSAARMETKRTMTTQPLDGQGLSGTYKYLSYNKDLIVYLGQEDTPYVSSRYPGVRFKNRMFSTNDQKLAERLEGTTAFGKAFWKNAVPTHVTDKIARDAQYLTTIPEDIEIDYQP